MTSTHYCKKCGRSFEAVVPLDRAPNREEVLFCPEHRAPEPDSKTGPKPE